MFDVFGLPLHPLVVHAVVVLLPLSALGLIACVLMNSYRPWKLCPPVQRFGQGNPM